jgi:NAD(P)-dependent dehydrogenase (short-subunit alcohol dehydrogenase family)
MSFLKLNENLHEIKNNCRRFDGQVVIVTGGARGLGLEIAKRIGQEGANIINADIQEDIAQIAANQLSDEIGVEVLIHGGDLSEAGVADAMAKKAYEKYGRIDALINNAAALIRMRLIDFTEDLLTKAINWNVLNAVRCCKAVLPYMMNAKYGRIVNIGGEAWRVGLPYHTLLAGVGKGALVGLTATLAGEVLQEGITVNCVSPGAISFVNTESANLREAASSRNPSWNPPDVVKAMAEGAALRLKLQIARPAHQSEIAAAVAFFASYESSYKTGQHIGVSGGMAML